MHDAETTTLRRAAFLLMCVSLIRWGTTSRPNATADAGSDVLPELIRRTDVAAEERARRERPLAEGERIDPNRADAVALDRLPGVGPAIAHAIVEARSNGAGFRSPDDLLVVRGVGPALLERIAGSIDLSNPPSAEPSRRTERRGLGGPVDVNRAGIEELQSLPGIGPVIAARVVSMRVDGPYRTVEELVRVPGIGPATVERLRGEVTVGLVR